MVLCPLQQGLLQFLPCSSLPPKLLHYCLCLLQLLRGEQRLKRTGEESEGEKDEGEKGEGEKDKGEKGEGEKGEGGRVREKGEGGRAREEG